MTPALCSQHDCLGLYCFYHPLPKPMTKTNECFFFFRKILSECGYKNSKHSLVIYSFSETSTKKPVFFMTEWFFKNPTAKGTLWKWDVLTYFCEENLATVLWYVWNVFCVHNLLLNQHQSFRMYMIVKFAMCAESKLTTVNFTV